MKTASAIETLITPAIEVLGFEIVSCGVLVTGKTKTLQVLIDTPQGVTIADCKEVSHQIGAILTVEMPTMGQYNLEISSPGLDRPLVKPAHYQQFINHRVHIRLHNALAGRKNFTGKLLGITDNQVHILVDNETFNLELENIDKANLIPDLRF